MDAFIRPLEVRWSDLDPNFHLRHSAYYDMAAYARILFLEAHGLTTQVMLVHQFGPILFREECIFRREIRLGDKLSIDLQLLRAKQDQSRWTIQHRFLKNEDQLAATLTVDGAWIDTAQRKLTSLPGEWVHVFEAMPRAENFEWIVK
ncbi:MAG TPA: thioesterase family protein [Chitinophagaceae bacterium]|nr:thioesterase family protein [Chitinophagaceae bacterium]